jgi:hypothetical protein
MRMKKKKRILTTKEMPSHPLPLHHHPRRPPAVVPEEIHEEGPMEAIPEQEDLTPREVTMTEDESETPQHHLYRALMRDYEDNPLRLEDDFDDQDGYLDRDRSNVDE